MRIRFILLALALLALFGTSTAWAQGPIDGLQPDPSLDRGSPRRAFEGFLKAGGKGDFLLAAHYLDLRGIPKAKQAQDGPLVAEKLHYVITHVGRFDVAKISDEPDAPPTTKGDPTLEVGELDVRDGPLPIGMSRVKFNDGLERWIFSKTTVGVAPTIYAALAKPSLGDRLPPQLRGVVFGNQIWQWIGLALLVPAGYLVAFITSWLLLRVLAFFARRTPTPIDDALVVGIKQPLQLLFVALLLDAASPSLSLTSSVQDVVEHITFTMLVIGGAWAAMRSVSIIAAGLVAGLADTPAAEMARRRLRTRLAIFQRLAMVLIVLVALAMTLLQFERVRAIGVSLLASAGLAGIVLGFAAQRSLGAVISGIQLSVTEPIRIGDNVVVEGEYGTVESIHLTQVVIALWDERRLVVPVTQFLDKPFQNWSKASEKLLGTIVVPCDFATPVAIVREELRRICEGSMYWDKGACVLQVTDVGDRSMQLRALVSAANPGALWDLRCEVREKLVAYLLRLDAERNTMPRTRYSMV